MMTIKNVRNLYNNLVNCFGNTIRIYDPATPRHDGLIVMIINQGRNAGIRIRIEWKWDTDELPKGTIGYMYPEQCAIAALSRMIDKETTSYIVKNGY